MIIVLPLGSRTRIASRWSGNSATTEASVETDRKTARPQDRQTARPPQRRPNSLSSFAGLPNYICIDYS